MDETYSVAEVAEILEIGKSKVYSLINSGELQSRKINGRIQITDDDLNSYLDRERHEMVINSITDAFKDVFGYELYETIDDVDEESSPE